MSETKAPQTTPSPDSPAVASEAAGSNRTYTSVFVSMALDMSWRLALAILVPIIGGVELDKIFDTSPAFIIAGFVLAMAGMGLVLWRTLQVANQQPVAKQQERHS